jgi:lysophospholipase L1-like esterase
MVDGTKGLQKKYGQDGVHPNNQGYKIMEKIIKPFLNH